MTSRARLLLVAAALVLAGPARAQGALSLLGFGYPIGQLSTRALATGGALAGIDPQSPLNPASIVLNGRSLVYVQYEPEFRSVNDGVHKTNTTIVRFPVFGMTGRQGNLTYGLSFSSFLDRTWANTYADTQVVNGERIASTVVTESQGGIADSRLALTWTFSEKLHIGVSGHLFPGQNRVVIGRIFPDSGRTGSFTLGNSFHYAGSAFSVGMVALPAEHVIVSADARFGGRLDMRNDSAVVGSGKIPGRLSAGVAYDGIQGSVFAARWSSERWSDLKGLGSASLGLHDAKELSLGAEVLGPRIQDSPTFFRLGYRSRELPFSYSGAAVNERTLSFGSGVPIAAGRTMIDVGLARAARSSGGVTESAWQLSIGVGIRP